MAKLTNWTTLALEILLFFSLSAAQADISVVLIETNYGDITVELYPEDAPITVENFLSYVEGGFYDGLIFHRVINGFMIQAGAFDADLYNFLAGDPNLSDPDWAHNPLFYHEPNDPIVNESSNGLLNLRGTIAMARTSELDSATSQFFINQVDNESLDATGENNGYTVFGEVVSGMKVVDTIAQLDTHYVDDSFEDLPDEPVIIEKITVQITFDAQSSDFSAENFLHADEATTRNFTGQGSFSGERFTHSFALETAYNVECLRWQLTAEPNSHVDAFNILLAKDNTETTWVFHYEENSVTLIDANSLDNIVPLSDLADRMRFRLLLGAYNPENLSDPNNTAVREEQDDTITEEIISFTEGIEYLPYFGEGLILVRQRRASDADDVRWRYYDESVGLALEIHDVSGDINADGWRLGWYGRNEPQFRGGSDDLRAISFIAAEPGDRRIFLGQGINNNSSFKINYATEQRLGVDCLKIEETESETQDEVTRPIRAGRTLLLARDDSGGLWLFQEILGEETYFEAEHIDQIVPSDLAQDMQLWLASGETADTGTTITTGAGENIEIEEVVSINSSLERFQDFTNELVLVKRSEEDADDEAPAIWSYYHESTGLVTELWTNWVWPAGAGSDFLPSSGDPNLPDPNSDGWYLWEPQQMENVVVKLEAGKKRESPPDSFKVWGDWDAQAEDLQNSDISLRVGPYRVTMNTEDGSFTRTITAKGKYIFQGSSDGVEKVTAVMDTNRSSFVISCQKVDLAGLLEPVKVELWAGNYYGAAIAEIKGNKDLPALLMRGQIDMLRYTYYRFAYDNGPNSYYSYCLTVKGDITTDVYPLDLTGREVSIYWGSREFSVPAGDNGLRRAGNREKFVYRNSENILRRVIIDLENCSFKIVIKKGHLSTPSQDLKIVFAKDEDSNFEQSITIP